MQQEVIDLCVNLKSKGLTWPQIAAYIETETQYRAPTGKPYHNAVLAATTLNSPSGASLRQRSFKKKSTTKVQPVSNGKKVKSKQGRPSKVSQVKDIIDILTKAGVSSKTLAKVLKEIV